MDTEKSKTINKWVPSEKFKSSYDLIFRKDKEGETLDRKLAVKLLIDQKVREVVDLLLASVRTDDDAERFLIEEKSEFSGFSPLTMMAAGQTDKVLEILNKTTIEKDKRC